jgi:acyl-CoA synthetase (AMP-forming)/AMP-acid ligase II
MTETSPVSAMTTTDDPIEKRIDSVGRLMPHVKAKIVNPSDWSQILGVGHRGELAVSGYLVMKGYWGDEKRTAESLVPDENGVLWMHTGDEASMDAEGYINITGRIKDLIIKGGENIHPLEVENCLYAHEKVLEVSVVGLPDERYGEVVAAFIVKQSEGDVTADEIRNWVREKLSHHLGKSWHLYDVDLLTNCSAEVCLLGRQLSQDSQREDPKVQIERAWNSHATRRQRASIISKPLQSLTPLALTPRNTSSPSVSPVQMPASPPHPSTSPYQTHSPPPP